MKLNCPKCSTEILRDQCNLKEGIGHCLSCNEYFKIANFLRDEEEIRRISKPIFSTIEIKEDENSIKISIPKMGWSATAIHTFLFAILWNGFFWYTAIRHFSLVAAIFISPFIITGILLIIAFLFHLKGSTRISFNHQFIKVSWQYSKLKYSRWQKSKNIVKMTEEVIYSIQYQPVYGIGLFFNNGYKIKFGSGLTEEERKWLIGELNERKRQFILDKHKQK